MTDTYQPDENLFQLRVRQQRGSAIRAMQDADSNPEDAARAVQLGGLSGTPPSIVNMDVEEHAMQIKRQAAFQILIRNEMLREWADQDPMNTKIAADDWDNLDEFTKHLQKLGYNRLAQAELRVGHQFFQGLKEPFLKVPNRSAELYGLPTQEAIAGTFGEGVAEAVGDIPSKIIGPLTYWPFRGVELGIELLLRSIGGVVGGTIKGAAQLAEEVGLTDEAGKRKLARELHGFAEFGMAMPVMHGIGTAGAGVKAKHGELVRPVTELEKRAAQAHEAARLAKPYLEAGEAFPPGLHPLLDKYLADEAKYDREVLDGIEEVADKIGVREISPESFGNLTKIVTQLEAEISPEAMLKLYGDTPPGPGDGLLGDRVPNIAKQLLDAADGERVRLPLSDYLLIDKEIRKELHDSVTTKKNGLTPEEGKLIPEPVEELKPLSQLYPDESNSGKFREALDSHRKATKSDPLFVREIKELTMVPMAEPRMGTHGFNIVDEIGRPVAELLLERSADGKDLYIKLLGGIATPTLRPSQVVNMFGPRLIRGLFQQIREIFPEAVTISGKRVSGAREGTPKAREEISIEIEAMRQEFPENMSELPGREHTKAEYEKFWDTVASGEWTRFNKFLEAQIIPTAEMSAKEAGLYAEIDKIISRVAPGIEHLMARGIRQEGIPQQGLYQPFMDRAPFIIWSLNALDPHVVGRHEAIHWLRQYNIIKPHEWDILVKAALDNDWIGKHKIEKTYRGEPLIIKLEEAIAQEFGVWGAKRAKEHATSSVFRKMMQVLTRVKNAIFRAFGREVTAQELFQKIESGEVGARGPQAPSPGRPGEPVPFDVREEAIPEAAQPTAGILPMAAKFPKQLELPIRRAEEMPPIEPGAIMPKERQELYLKRWDEQRQAEQDAVDRIVEKEISLREEQRWKDRAGDMLQEVEEHIRAQPEFLISNFFRRGVFYGDKVKDFMPKIDPAFLTKEEKDNLPKAWLKKDGYNPDDLAPLFNIDSGQEMIARMLDFEHLKGDLQPRPFFDLMVGKELERRLEKEFGKKEDVIMAEVREHQFGGRNWDLYHEDTMAMAMKAGQEPPISKGEFREQAKVSFGQKLMKHVSWGAIERMMYTAGGKLEDAVLRGDYAQAYRFTQSKEKAHLYGMDIKSLVTELAQYVRVVDKYGKREPKFVDADTTNFVHLILNQIGETTKRSDADIALEISKGNYKTGLVEFVQKKRADGWDLYMPDFLYDPKWRKNVNEMTVDEFRAVREAIISMDKQSRMAKLNDVNGELIETNALIDRFVETLRELPTKPTELRLDLPSGTALTGFLQSYWAQSLQLEAMFNRFDRGNPLGIFNQAIVRKYTTAANKHDADNKLVGEIFRQMEKEFPIKSPNKVVYQNLFIDPTTGEFFKFSRMNILVLLANIGNEGNFLGLLDGYNIPRSKANLVMDLIRNNTFHEDWLRQQAMSERIWGVLKDNNDAMRRELSGIAPTRVPVFDSIIGPQGKRYKGWYHPIIYDERLPQKNPDIAGAKSLIEFPYWAKQVLPGAPHAKQRTGYVGPYLLEFDGLAHRMSMMVRDTVWRPVLLDLQKIFRDDRFKAALTRHYGAHYTALLEPFLQDIAGNTALIDKNAGAGLKAVQFMRQNVISHMVGLNPYTIAKHDLTALIQSITEVGASAFGRALYSVLFDRDPASTGSWHFALNKSQELQRRHKNAYQGISTNFDRTYGDLAFSRDLRDTLETFRERPVGEALLLTGKEIGARYMRLRDMMHYVEAWPLATLDLASAVPTWTAKYTDAIRAGHNEGQAVFLADRAVRRAHGSTVITNRPGFMRSNPFMANFVSFYAFFNHILMRQYEEAWAIRGALNGQGYYVKEPTIDRTTGQFAPLIVQRGRKDMRAEVGTKEEYEKTDAYKQGKYLVAPLAMMMVSYFIVPAWIEEFVQPSTSPQEAKRAKRGLGTVIQGPKKDQSYFSYGAQVQMHGLAGSWLGVRDLYFAATHGGEVGAGVLGETSKVALKLLGHVKKEKPKTIEEQQKILRSSAEMFNLVFGIGAPKSVVRSGIFGANWYRGKEKPQNFREFWHGIGHGTLKEH